MIYLLRHSIDDNTRKGGWSSAELTEDGVKLAQEIVEKLHKLRIDKIVCSDLVRAKQTCEIINKKLNLPVVFVQDLREFNAGVVSGMKYDEADRLYPLPPQVYKDMNFKYPNGETLGEFKNRVIEFYNNTIKQSDNVLYITHRNVISVIYNYINNSEWNFLDKKTIKIQHCSLFAINTIKGQIHKVI